MSIRSLQPEKVWNCFADMCNCPRPSKHEEKIAAYLMEFAKEHGIHAERDEIGNVLLRKPASPGFENRTPIAMQGHMDMVPQKNEDVEHNFLTDPIKPVIDGDWVKASGTTLGSDNGLGVALALAILSSDDIQHGPIEALFTVDEETGMTGAFNLKPGWLQAKYLLNLDSEEEGVFYIGCAGGVDFNAEMPYTFDSAPSNAKTYEISISGCKGGHSGIEINLGRLNPVSALARFLWVMIKRGVCVSEFEGGNMRNAIPRSAKALITVPAREEEGFLSVVSSFQDTLRSEYEGVEDSILVEAKPELPVKNVMDKASEAMFFNALNAIPNGPQRMVPGKDLVETSTNLSIVKVKEGQAMVGCLLRSSVDSAKRALAQRMEGLFELIGADVTLNGDYPGWKPLFDSNLLKIAEKTYTDMFGNAPVIEVIHAGLECGIIGRSYPEMEMISFGPTLLHPHSPEETANIPSVAKTWNFLKELVTKL